MSERRGSDHGRDEHGTGQGHERGRGPDRRAERGSGRQRPPARERSAQHRSSQRPSERARRTDPARLTAYTAMREVAAGAYANLLV
ncbi:MAG TPA: rRNA small subunit methyltransferase B, partial [Intrasporangium sp.]|nr:rRNA small subunit methyltransferase B [Intrasporangium sp.]